MFSTDPLESAARMVYALLRCGGPSIRRIRCGKAFRYVCPHGEAVRYPKQDGTKLHLHFREKSGQEHSIELTNRRLANIVRRCQ
jgi:DNA topoisomerase IB